MLPLPGAPSTSWAMYRARFRAAFEGANPRVCLAFWFFGLINNVLYVIILSAALDLVGPSVPKGVVLLADVVPSFLTKLIAPYFIHLVPYPIRILIFAALSTTGMLLIALTPAYTDGGTITTKMTGVVLASLSSGGGELSFLGLTHFYGAFSLASWGSGTGAAGLVGAGLYALATTALGMTVKATLIASAVLPIGMLVAFFVVLPRGPMRELAKRGKLRSGVHLRISDSDVLGAGNGTLDRDDEEDVASTSLGEDQGLLHTVSSRSNTSTTTATPLQTFQSNLRRARGLFIPYMLPLLLVYIAEYTINQGVAPTLLFPLPSTPFTSYRSFYPTYAFIYQAGVFISRSSLPLVRIHHLYPPSVLQIANLIILTLHAMFNFIPNVWFVFMIVFWEGLLGGLVYVNTFAEILDKVPEAGGEREWSLGATTVSDSGGITVAGFLSMAMEVALCKWQVARGRDYCRKN